MKVTLLATSDIHGYLYSIDDLDATKELPHGLFKAATVIEEERAKAEGPVVLIDNGDFIQGSLMSQYVKENERSPKRLYATLNTMEYDAGIIGNHEFNYGIDYLIEGMNSLNHPVLSANVQWEKGGYLADAPATIIEKDGIKIGILGLTTTFVPRWEHPDLIQGLNFPSAVETAKEWVPKLKESTDVVVVAYHGGFESDLVTGEPTEKHTGENEGYQLLKEVPGIDVLITGHQHRRIATVIDGVPVVQPGYKGSHVGKITLEFDTVDGKVVNIEAVLLPVVDAPIHEELSLAYNDLKESMLEWMDEVIGETSGDMKIEDAALSRMHKHPYVEFINQVQLYYGQADISATSLFTDVVPGYGKEISTRDVLLNYPFQNTLAVIEITGIELKAALEQTADYFALDSSDEIVVNPQFVEPKEKPYNYDMYEGINYVIDVSKPVGERITLLNFKGKAVQPDDRFELVTNQYRAIGGGNFDMFKDKEFIREVNVSMSDLITEYVKEHKIIDATVNNNFQVINGK